MVQGEACGKIILFNEHFVVYGIPAIACAIGMKITTTIKPSPVLNFINKLKTASKSKFIVSQQLEVIKTILQKLNQLKNSNLEISLEGDLIPASGIGVSAASSISITKALANYFKLNISLEEINQIGFECEKIFHGTPSGIDNTVATYCKSIWFEKNTPSKIETINIKNPLKIVIAYSGIPASTKDAIAKVKTQLTLNPKLTQDLFNLAKKIAIEGKDALINFDLNKIGALMNQNHTLLQKLGVSNDQLERLVTLARKNGALGAKITGSGLGGCIVALAKDENDQNQISRAIEQFGFTTIKTEVTS